MAQPHGLSMRQVAWGASLVAILSAGTTVTSMAGAAGAGGTGGSGGANVCDQACSKLDNECGMPGTCDAIKPVIGLDCSDPNAECPGQCLMDASCAAILSLISGTPDQTLTNCLSACDATSGCVLCMGNNCVAQLTACQNDAACQAFLQCAGGCDDGDGACVNGCATSNPGAGTTSALTCAAAFCSTECGVTAGTGGQGGTASGGNTGTGGDGGAGTGGSTSSSGDADDDDDTRVDDGCGCEVPGGSSNEAAGLLALLGLALVAGSRRERRRR